MLSQSSGISQEVPVRPKPPLLPVLPGSHCSAVPESRGWLLPDLALSLSFLPFIKWVARLPRWWGGVMNP